MTQLEFPLYLRSTRRIILEGGEVVIASSIRDLAEDVLGRQGCESGQKKLDIKKLAMVPLVMNWEPLGLVTFMFDHEEIDVGDAGAARRPLHAGPQSGLDQEEAGRFSEVDEVTWLRNRRYFKDTLARGDRAGAPLQPASLRRSPRYRRLHRLQRGLRPVHGRQAPALRGHDARARPSPSRR